MDQAITASVIEGYLLDQQNRAEPVRAAEKVGNSSGETIMTPTLIHCSINTPIGPMVAYAQGDALCALEFDTEPRRALLEARLRPWRAYAAMYLWKSATLPEKRS